MFSLWTAWLQTWGFILHNYGWLYPVSTVTRCAKILADDLYKFCTNNLPNPVHCNFSIITEVISGLYPQSTEPITTTTLI